MNDAKNVARILIWLAFLGLATLLLGVILDQIKGQVKA